jgi:serine kinase of HPr protein (carbohydrate metabolism regulator)
VARDGRSIVTTKLDARLLFARGLPLAASLQGVVCLHASAVVVEGRAVAICGASGAGKSTLAAALVAEGAAFLTDDVLALTAGHDVIAHPGPAFASVGAEWAGLGRVVGESDKLHVEPPARGVPAEVGAVFVLGAAAAAPPVQLLLASAFVGRVDDAASQVALLDVCARLAANVPVERLEPASPRELAARVLRGL